MAPTPRAAPPVPEENKNSSKLDKGILIGCVVGGVVLVALVVGFLVYL